MSGLARRGPSLAQVQTLVTAVLVLTVIVLAIGIPTLIMSGVTLSRVSGSSATAAGTALPSQAARGPKSPNSNKPVPPPTVGTWRAPAEFEEQQAIWFAWPTFEPISGRSNIPTILNMTKTLTEDPTEQDVYMIVSNSAEENRARLMMTAEGIDLDRVTFSQVQRTDFWIRDYFFFLKNDDNNDLAVVGFNFNCWAMGNSSVSKYFQAAAKTDEDIDLGVATNLGVELRTLPYYGEQGGMEFNGQGKLILSEAVFLQPERNPGVTKAELEQAFKAAFGLTEIIWLPKFRYANGKEEKVLESDPDYYSASGFGGGLLTDDSTFNGLLPLEPIVNSPEVPTYDYANYQYALNALTTNGHTDEFVRFINPTTVLLAQVPADEVLTSEVGRRTSERLEFIRDILDGAGLNIIRIPTAPEKIYYLGALDDTYIGMWDMFFTAGDAEGDLVLGGFPGNPTVAEPGKNPGEAPVYSARSYLNYVITNKHVFMPAYAPDHGNDPAIAARDLDAKMILEMAFPTRTVVVAYDVDSVNIGGGGVHCITQHMPTGNINTQ